MTAQQQYGTLQRRIRAVAQAAEPFWHQGDGHGGAVMDSVARACVDQGLPAPDTRDRVRPLIDTLAKRDGWWCHYCGRPLGWGNPVVVAPEADHVVPRAAGGGDEPANRVLACGECNLGKGVTAHDQFPHDCPGLP